MRMTRVVASIGIALNLAGCAKESASISPQCQPICEETAQDKRRATSPQESGSSREFAPRMQERAHAHRR